MAEKEYKTRAVYLMVPRKFVITAIVAYCCLTLGVITSFQWASFVDRRSNQRWCDIVTLSNSAYKAQPPSTVTGQKIAKVMSDLQRQFHCK